MATTRTTPPAENRGWRSERLQLAVMERPRPRAAPLRRYSSAALIAGVFALASASVAGQTPRYRLALADENQARDNASNPAPDAATNEFLAALFAWPSGDEVDGPGEPIYLAQAGLTYPGVGAGTAAGYPSATPTSPNAALPGPRTAVRQPPFVASLAVTETLTNNVNLASGSLRQGDLVTELVPQVRVFEKGARSTFSGFLAAPTLLYVHTSQHDTVYPNVELLGNVEAVEQFFFIDAAVSVSQQFLSPFGAQPADLTNVTNNRYTSEVYRVTPYIKGTSPGDIKYELRNNNLWTNNSGTAVSTNNAYYNQWLGNITSPVAPYGWEVDYERDSVKFQGQSPLVTQVGRLRLPYQIDPELQISGTAGYEDNHYFLTDYRGAVYGAGLRWNPNPRAKLVANWEHRFFGASYLFTFQDRGPLSVVDVRAERNITSYPQQFLSLPATTSVPSLLNSIFSSSIPDPVEREAFVENLIQTRGLPSSLASPLNLYNEQISLVEDARGTVGLLGARNSILFTGFYVRYQPINAAGAPLPPPLLTIAGNNSTQKGVAITWTHNLAPQAILELTGTRLRTTLNIAPFGATTQSYVTLRVSDTLSINTTVFAGARYQRADSDLTAGYTEAAVFVGFNHVFK